MTFVTSARFASAAASGGDWREVTRQLLEMLEPSRTREEPFTIGFLYVTDALAADIPNIYSMLRSVTGIENWVGSVGLGVCGAGVEYVDRPAASIMLASIPRDSFQVFPASDLSLAAARPLLDPWLDRHDAMLTLVHGDTLDDTDPATILAELERLTGGFIVGGLCSSRAEHFQIANAATEGGIGGVVFSSDINVATTLTQGCAPIGPAHTITRAERNIIMELDGRGAFDVFADDLKDMALARAGQDPAGANITQALLSDDADLLDDQVQSLFRGEVHVAFPVSGSDQRDYLVRDIAGVDPDSGWVAVAQGVAAGERMMFVHRDDETVRTDLARALLELRERVTRQNGGFAPQGAVYISCVARAQASFAAESDVRSDSNPAESALSDPGNGEMRMIRDLIGDVPLAGFYANGEISNHRLYGYTGVLILFL